MRENIPKDLKTRAYVLRRTNYGEADRILNLITPFGKISAMAKGVRKSRSKLAGACEMLTLMEANLHFGRSEMAVLTGAKMVRFYSKIVGDYTRMELASLMLKEINRAAEQVDNPEFFEILDKSLSRLDDGDLVDLIYAWFLLNLTRAKGEQVNLYADVDGAKLTEGVNYTWDVKEKTFFVDEAGISDASVIKILRLMVSADLAVIFRIKNVEKYIPEILKIAKSL